MSLGTKGPSILGIASSASAAIKIDEAADDEAEGDPFSQQPPVDVQDSRRHNLDEYPRSFISYSHLEQPDAPYESCRVGGFRWTLESISQELDDPWCHCPEVVGKSCFTDCPLYCILFHNLSMTVMFVQTLIDSWTDTWRRMGVNTVWEIGGRTLNIIGRSQNCQRAIHG